MCRPEHLVAVLGTGTGVGKTYVAASLLTTFRAEPLRVAVRKPAQSFSPGEVTDAEILGRASGEAPESVCLRHRWYEQPMAPPMAARALGRPGFRVADLVAELTWPEGVDVGLFEGAGGVRSPLADDGDAVDLLACVAPDLVVLVAGAGLGTINLVRMSVAALARWSVVVYLNGFSPGDGLHGANREWLVDREDLSVVTDLDGLCARVQPGARSER